jgi:TonB-linked SusC/RagA family outer membrane protein
MEKQHKKFFWQGNHQIGFLSYAKCVCCFLLVFAGAMQTISAAPAGAQSTQQTKKKVVGNVKDENGEALIGVTIAIKGQSAGTVTDINGNFSLEVSQPNVLVVSYIGYTRQFIDYTGQQTLAIKMLSDAEKLGEVVVVGYGTQKRSHLTGSVETINPSKITDLPGGNLGSSLRGLVNGLGVSGGDSRPGVGALLTLRDGKTPIYVIDDYVYEMVDRSGGNPGAAAFNNLDPNEIESISILKDAAAAVYGARSSGGAILVRTKRGKDGAPKISYSTQFTTNDAISRPKMMNSYDYGVFYNRFASGNPKSPITNLTTGLFQADELEAMKGINYNSLDDAWKAGYSMKHNLNLSGGSKDATYFASISYYDQEGNLGNVKYNRWNYRAGSEVKVASHLKLGLQLSGNYGSGSQTFSKVGGESVENDYKTLLTTPTYMPTYVGGYPLLRYGLSNNERNQIQRYNYSALQDLGNTTVNNPQEMLIGANLAYNFDWSKHLKGLEFKLNYTKAISTNEGRQYGSKYKGYYFTQRGGSGNHLYIDEGIDAAYPGGLLDSKNLKTVDVDNGNRILRDMERTDRYQLNFIATYNRKFGQHAVSGLFTVEKSETNNSFVRFMKETPIENYTGESNGAIGAVSSSSQTTRAVSGMLSYVGRFNYSYADKYLLEFLVRSDASTKFAPENYWGTFPSLSAGWVMSEEDWFKTKVSWVDFLKVRGSFGILGFDNTDAWAWQQRYTYQANKGAVLGGDNNIGWGMKMEKAPNYNGHWDKSYKYNVGIDSRFLRNRLSVGVDAYYTQNKDMLVARTGSLPLTVGAAVAKENYDATDTYGIEISLSWKDKIGDFNYNVGLNTGYSDGRYRKKDWSSIIKLGEVYPNSPIDMGVWGYNCTGMFRSQDQITQYFADNKITKYVGESDLTKIVPGALIYRDVRGAQQADGSYGAPDGVVDENDYVQIAKHSSNVYGFTLNLGGEWKGLSFSTQLATSWGGYSTLPSTAKPTSLSVLEYTNVPAFWNDMFMATDVLDGKGNVVAPANVNAKYPNMMLGVNSQSSNFWKVSSLRMVLRNFTLGYSLPKNFVKVLSLESCRFNLTGNNLLSLFNPYPDNFMDPLSSYDAYPTLRSFSLGVNLTF